MNEPDEEMSTFIKLRIKEQLRDGFVTVEFLRNSWKSYTPEFEEALKEFDDERKHERS